jgi:glutathione synthase/RimK-type ligase-like ATP-grasp enzyme
MIVLWGIHGDEPMDLVRAALDRLRQSYVLVDQQAVGLTSLNMKVGKTVSGWIKTRSFVIDLESVTAVYLRPYDSRQMSVVQREPEGSPIWRHALNLEDAMLTWIEITPALVVNRPTVTISNNSKPYQAKLIQAAGLRVPDTLVTTDAEAVREFWQLHGEIIYKSVSGVRSIVSRLGEDHRSRLATVANCPTQFQEFIPGNDWRVHVVGDKVFSCEVLSDADDYRYPGRSGETVQIMARELSEELKNDCLRLSKMLRLPVCGIDLRCTPQGDWYCFEVNPSPGFSFYEQATGQPIADAIARFLAAGQ